MRFLMFVCIDTVPVPAPTTPLPDVDEWVATHDASGARITGEVLEPESKAATVRVREGRTVITDGPFLETKEVLAGFDLIECADLDAAIAIAAGHPMAYTGVIELRPLMEF